MSTHAELSPSAADRWMVCAGSVVLSKDIPNKSSSFADEGTLAHSVAEALLSGKPLEGDDTVTQEMLDHVGIYVNHVESLGGKLHIEQKVKVNDFVYGTADAVVWREGDKSLFVSDLKYGAGVPVEINDNLQLKIYALATLLTFSYAASTVTATIVQPRCPHSAGPVRSVTFDVVDLLDFHADLEDAVERVRRAKEDAIRIITDGGYPVEHLKPSDKGCRWCPAAGICPALKNKSQALAKKVFAPSLPYNPAELAETLEFLPIIESWVKNVREFAYSEAVRGIKVPGYKLVEKQANRKFKPGIAQALMKDFVLSPEQVFKPQELLGIGEIEKLMPGKNAEIRAKALEPYVTKESSGLTLVPSSDKRPEVKCDAKSVFGSVL